MAVLESCPKHNMVAYLEKTEGNAEFHEVSAKSKIINNVRYITAKVAGKPVSISEASIRSDLLFDDADGIDSLSNQALYLFALQRNAKKKFVMYPRFISIFLDKQLVNVPVPLDHFPINALTSKVFSFMVKKGKHFSGKVTPLFASMLVQSTEDDGATLERPSEPQPTPSPPHPSDANIKPQSDPSPRPSPTPHIPDSIPEVSGGNHGGQSSSDKSLSGNESDMTLQSVYALCISLCTQSRYQNKTNEIKTLEGKDQEAQEASQTVITNPELGCRVCETKKWNSNMTEKEGTEDAYDMEEEGTARTMIVPLADEGSCQAAFKRNGEKGVELKDVKETERPRPTSTRSLLTLKPLPKIDPKDKGKKKIEEGGKRNFDEKGVSSTLVEKIRAKFLHDTIAAQRRFLAKQRAIAIRNKPPTRTQLRNQMMTYLKHVGNKKHSDLKSKTFEEIQALYEKVKRFDESFTAVGSTEDERRIKEMNEGVKDTNQKRLKEEDTAQVPTKVEVTEQGTKKRKGGHIKMIARKKPRKQSDVDSDDEHRKCLRIVTFEGTIDSEIMEKKSFIARLNKVSSPDGDYLVIYRANGNFRAFNYLMEVLHIFDRQDLYHLYNLMLEEQYSETTLEGIELILWGDLKIMMESSTEENDQSDFWSNQQDWKIVTWRLYEACGVCILEFEDGTVIHMLVERRYPFSKELLQRMLDLGLEVERESTVALDLIRFIKKQIDEE
ncbi:hypothetical protein Tco_0565091 [Tanacetum coccineum]